jgi:site-specific recombinase XerD
MLPVLERTQETAAIAIAQSTEEMIRLWLHGKSANTIKSYRRDIYEFLTYAGGVETQSYAQSVTGFRDGIG